MIYARVSSKEQEKEGFSIPAQLKLLREYAHARDFSVLHEFVDVQTAKREGRPGFSAMLAFFKKHSARGVLLVEKTDRLYRTFRDYVTIDELGIEIHFAKEGTVISPDSHSSQKFMHVIKVGMARQYIDNLSEEARKGLREKADEGIFPGKAPLGYTNVKRADGKRVIEPDSKLAPHVTRMYERYSTGLHSLEAVKDLALEDGVRFRRTGARISTATVHNILRSPVYMGDFLWKGNQYSGIHTPLVTRELWERVQMILNRRSENKTRKATHDFAFSGLITCGHCGCALVGELKKRKYVYYHCTGYKGRCPEPYVREEALEKRFTELLRGLRFDDEVLGWVTDALRESHSDQKRHHDEAIARLQAEYTKLKNRIDAAYIDKLDGKIDGGFFERKATEWRGEQANIRRSIENHEGANQTYLTEGVKLLELASRSHALFEKQPASEKRRLLNFVLSNCTWKGGELTAMFRQPFDIIANMSATATKKKAEGVTSHDLHLEMLGN